MKRAVFYGDSNTYGFDPRHFIGGRYSEEIRWTCRTGQALSPSWEVLEEGENGRSIPFHDAEERLLMRKLEQWAPFDLLAVMLGSNDILRLNHPSAEQTAEKMDRLLSVVEEKGRLMAHPFSILLVSPVPVGRRPVRGELVGDPYMALFQKETGKLAGLYGEIAHKHGCFFADAGKWGIPLACDQIHFSEEGHRRYAEKLTACLSQLDL